MQIYVVQQGDTVNSIAMAFGVDADTLIYNNQIGYSGSLAIGQALLILEGNEIADRRTLQTNGYAYPFINDWVLRQTLPYLTQLSIFSYGFTEEGDLVPPELDETRLLEAAYENNTVAVLTLTPFGADGTFNNYLINVISTNQTAQQNLIAQLIETVREKGYGGVNIDFEFILPEDRYTFPEFVRNVTTALNEFGYFVSVALAPKTSVDQPGLLYEGKDYELLGAAANESLLMTYEWGYTYGPPMAVAPINKVREVLDFAVTQIPREKISMGIPNYGYDWELPFQRGITRARVIGNVEAVEIAIAHNVPIQFDEIAMTPFFRYIDEGVTHEVWFEDVRSMQAKLELVQEYGFRGAFYWQIMELFRANWLLVDNTFWIEK